jgi:hypothetical protein
MNPLTHEQLPASTHPPAHSESGRHRVQIAAPRGEYMSAGHGSWCDFPRQYSPASHGTHALLSLNTVPAAHGLHTPRDFIHPRSHTHSVSDAAPVPAVCANATHPTHRPACEYVSAAHSRSCEPSHSYPAGHARHASPMNHDPAAHPSHPFRCALSQKQSPSQPDPATFVV